MSDELLELAAEILGPVLDEVVFVGGATIHLWLTERAVPGVRATDDVDVICDVATYGQYQALAEQLRQCGLREAIDEPVICRWRHDRTRLAIDVMPTSEGILGFSNPWYDAGIRTAVARELSSGVSVRAMIPPVLVASKLAAWHGRGNGDVLKSLDVHDIVVLVNGRPELGEEIEAQQSDLRTYVANEVAALLADQSFDYVLQDAVTGYGDAGGERAVLLRSRLEALVTG